MPRTCPSTNQSLFSESAITPPSVCPACTMMQSATLTCSRTGMQGTLRMRRVMTGPEGIRCMSYFTLPVLFVSRFVYQKDLCMPSTLVPTHSGVWRSTVPMNRVVIMSYMVSAGAQSSTMTTRCFRRVNTSDVTCTQQSRASAKDLHDVALPRHHIPRP